MQEIHNLCVFNKYITTFLTSNRCFKLKYESFVHTFAFCSESGEKYAQFKHCLQLKTV